MLLKYFILVLFCYDWVLYFPPNIKVLTMFIIFLEVEGGGLVKIVRYNSSILFHGTHIPTCLSKISRKTGGGSEVAGIPKKVRV